MTNYQPADYQQEHPVAELTSNDQLRERRSFLHRWWVVLSSQFLVLIAILAAWEFVSGRFVREFYVSKPSLIALKLADWFETGEVWIHLAVTLQEAVLGFAIGATAGLVVGLALARIEFLAKVLSPFIVALNSLPKVALAPLFILWFGIGLPMKVMLTVVIVFFLVFYNTFTGAREVDNDLLNVLRTMGASKWQLLSKVIIPSALVWVSTGLRISIPNALIGAVVGEIFASNRGLGYLIQASGAQFDTAGVFAGLFLLVLVASGFNILLGYAEGIFLRWRVASRSER